MQDKRIINEKIQTTGTWLTQSWTDIESAIGSGKIRYIVQIILHGHASSTYDVEIGVDDKDGGGAAAKTGHISVETKKNITLGGEDNRDAFMTLAGGETLAGRLTTPGTGISISTTVRYWDDEIG